MKKVNLKWIVLFIVSITILTGCRTMQLNQDGKTLGKGMFESAAGVGAAVVLGVAYPWSIAPDINVEFQQRFGVGEKTEVQFKVHNDFAAMGALNNGFGFSQQNEIDFSVKVNVYEKNGYAFSLLPFGGVAFGLVNTAEPSKGGIIISYRDRKLPFFINPNTGLAFIGSKSGLRYNFYWGGTINISPNVTLCVDGKPSFETDFTFNWGFEIPKDRVVYRHEIALFSQMNWLIEQDSCNGSHYLIPCINFGLSYHFSAGVRYNPGQRQVRE